MAKTQIRLTDIVDPNRIQDADGDTHIKVEATADGDEAVITAAGVEVGRIHSDGAIDFPEQSGVTVKRSADQTLSTSVPTKIQFDNLAQAGDDAQSEWDLVTNYRFTAEKDGYYFVGCAWLANNNYGSLAGCTTYLYKNDGLVTQELHHAGNGVTFSGWINCRMWLDAGDFIDFRALGGGVAPVVEADNTFAYVHKLA